MISRSGRCFGSNDAVVVGLNVLEELQEAEEQSKEGVRVGIWEGGVAVVQGSQGGKSLLS